jgi:transposase
VETSVSTVERVRRAWAAGGLAAADHRKAPSGRRPRKLDGAAEARLVALACGAPPVGRDRWTPRPLADRLVELAVFDGIAPNTVRAVLKRARSSPG